jgi:hypothetical protein
MTLFCDSRESAFARASARTTALIRRNMDPSALNKIMARAPVSTNGQEAAPL